MTESSWEKPGNYDIIFCIDKVVLGKEFEQEKAAAQKIIEQMTENDRARFVLYSYEGCGYGDYTYSNEEALEYIQNIRYLYDAGLETARYYNSGDFEILPMIYRTVFEEPTNNKIAFIISTGKNEVNRPEDIEGGRETVG